MNKKFLTFGVIGLFAVMLVSAGVILHYTQVQQEINVNSPITITGLLTPEVIEGLGTGYFLSTNLVTAENIAPFDVNVNVNSVAKEGEVVTDDIITSYVNELELTKKSIVTWQSTGDPTITIGYIVVGDTFEYEVIDGEIPAGYELVYAMDKENRFTDYATVKTISEINSLDESLPMVGDWNANVIPTEDYCGHNGFDDYMHCRGAKLWIVKSDNIGTNGVLSWVNMADYYYETDLVYYFNTVSGNTVIPEGVSMEFYPLYEFGAIEGAYTVTTSVNPVA